MKLVFRHSTTGVEDWYGYGFKAVHFIRFFAIDAASTLRTIINTWK